METMILIAQTTCLLLQALWLTTGVRDNILYPSINETLTSEVMNMSRMRADYPEAYAFVAHRRVDNKKLQKLAFKLVVTWELLTAIVLWLGTISLAVSAFGWIDPSTAKTIALAGVLMFTIIWAMFLIVGNHFSYWFGHEGAQNTHFQLTIWGTCTLLFLAL